MTSEKSRNQIKKERTRQIFLHVARKLFTTKGVYWTTIEDLTQEADVAKGTFYQYFETKEKLLNAVLKQGLDLLKKHILEKMKGSSSLKQALRNAVEAHYEFLIPHADYHLLFHQVRGLLVQTSEHTEEIRKTYKDYFSNLKKGFQPYAKNKNKLNSAEAQLLVLELSAFSLGLFTHLYLFGHEKPSHRDLSRFSDRIMNGLGKDIY